MNHDDHIIISTYGAEYRGLVQYYLLAGDVWRLNRLQWVMQTSMLKTLAGKHRSSVSKMAARYKATIETPHGPRTCFQASVERAGRKPLVARFGGIPLRRQQNAVLTDRQPVPVTIRRKELISTAPARPVRDVRAHRTRCRSTTSASSPTSPTRDGHSRHGRKLMAQTATQDPRGLRRLPRRHPCTGNPPRQPRSSHWRAG